MCAQKNRTPFFAVSDKVFILQIALLEVCKGVVKASVLERPAR